MVHGCSPAKYYDSDNTEITYSNANEEFKCKGYGSGEDKAHEYNLLKNAKKENLVIDLTDKSEQPIMGLRRLCAFLEERMDTNKAAEIVFSVGKSLNHPHIKQIDTPRSQIIMSPPSVEKKSKQKSKEKSNQLSPSIPNPSLPESFGLTMDAGLKSMGA